MFSNLICKVLIIKFKFVSNDILHYIIIRTPYIKRITSFLFYIYIYICMSSVHIVYIILDWIRKKYLYAIILLIKNNYDALFSTQSLNVEVMLGNVWV